MKYKLYEVGGKIRDEFLGIKSKDIDYTVVIENPEQYENSEKALEVFVDTIKSEGFEVFLVTEPSLTVCSKFPKNHKHAGLVADFVLARKEIGYIPGTRMVNSVLGTLEDDLLRRDFTVNAMAKDLDGNLIDLFNGEKDLIQGVLRTTGDACVSINDDPLRILRALRFSVTKSLSLSDDLIKAIELFDYTKFDVVSTERVREELKKMFKFDTLQTIKLLTWLEKNNKDLLNKMFEGDIWLKPTNEK